MNTEQLETLAKKYMGRMEKVMLTIQTALNEADIQCCLPGEEGGTDRYGWNMYIGDNPDEIQEEDIDINFYIVPEEDESTGVTFSIDVIAVSGRIIGGLTPYNYTDQCFVYTEEEIEERFKIFEECDPYSMVCLIEEYLKDTE